MGERGFAIEAALGPRRVASLARRAEELGYVAIWCNDTPGADGVAAAAAMLGATQRIGVGVGVAPLDRRPADELAAAVAGLDLSRFVLGIGAGSAERPLEVVRAGVRALRAGVPGLDLAVAAMGPRMCRLAGELADAVLLNWMTPERIAWARGIVERARPASPARLGAYVRVAFGEDARGALAEQERRYRTFPHYARHFEAQGAPEGTVGVVEEDLGSFRRYEEVLDLALVRPVVSGTARVEDVLEAMAPGA